jgi:tetratricopeptide (TPR) repeat protein
MKPARLVVACMLACLCTSVFMVMSANATPITPTHDDEVIDVLPATAGSRSEERKLRKQLAQQPRDAQLALSIARRYLDQAHQTGDPRFAGMALSAIGAWTDAATMPDGVLMMRATLQQYLHAFDDSAASLQRLVARPGLPRPQAWLTLATVRRVQGRYVDSDAACKQVTMAGAQLHGSACLAENAALRGNVERARATFAGLLANGRNPTATQAWLTTSLAELEQRAGNAAAAETAYRAALKIDTDPYTVLAFADFLIEQRRPAQALMILKDQTQTDAVLLRLAIAGTQAKAQAAVADAAQMRDRIALADERPDAKVLHGREQAMFALTVDKDATRAFDLARGDVAQQREPLDLLMLAQAAQASGNTASLQEAKKLVREMGLVDQRIEAIIEPRIESRIETRIESRVDSQLESRR